MDDSPFQIDTSAPASNVRRNSKKGDPDRGRVIVLLVSISIIALEGISFLLDSRGPNIVRWILTLGLIFGLISGVQWIRWLTIVLFIFSFCVALVLTISSPSPILFGLLAYMAVVVFVLCGSNHVSAFFRTRRT